MNHRHIYLFLFAVAYAVFVYHAARLARIHFHAARYRHARRVSDWFVFWAVFAVAAATAPLWSAPLLLFLPSWWVRRWWERRRPRASRPVP